MANPNNEAVVSGLHHIGIENGLLIDKYTNLPALREDTLKILTDWKAAGHLIDLADKLTHVWYPSGCRVAEEAGCGWPHRFDIPTEVMHLVIKAGFPGVREEEDRDL